MYHNTNPSLPIRSTSSVADASDITDTKAEKHVNSMSIVSFYEQLTFAWQSLPRKWPLRVAFSAIQLRPKVLIAIIRTAREYSTARMHARDPFPISVTGLYYL